MNVYILRPCFSSHAFAKPEKLQEHLSEAFSNLLAQHNMNSAFKSVSQPYANNSVAIICTAEAAAVLERAKDDLKISSLTLDEGRTQRRQRAYAALAR